MLYLEKSYHKTMSSTKPRLNFVCLRTESCLNFTSKLRNEPTSNKSNIVVTLLRVSVFIDFPFYATESMLTIGSELATRR